MALSGVRSQVSGVGFQVSGVRCQVSEVRFQVSGFRGDEVNTSNYMDVEDLEVYKN